MLRSIKFSKFRNIGLDKDDYLILNGDFKKGNMGGLLVLIGANNSGKSNVLEGIIKSCNGAGITRRDITDLSYEDKDKVPTLALSYKTKNYVFEYQNDLNNQPKWKIVFGEKSVEAPSIKIIKKTLIDIQNNLYQRYGRRYDLLTNLNKRLDEGSINDDELYKETINVMKYFHDNYQNGGYPSRTTEVWNYLVDQKNPLALFYEELFGDDLFFIAKQLKQETGLDNPLPRCIVYKEKSIGSKDLFVDGINQVTNNRFFTSLFKAIKVDIKTIQNCYDQYNQNRNIQVLKKYEKEIQKKISKISKQFNDMYFASNDEYLFTLVLESQNISFGIARGKGEDAINLDYQSTGFRWFFNLFFNFLLVDELRAGDIVIMDEPATNLHVQGQNELRNFIKNFGIENDVLFVIATHSPFLIDVDHYDELRVVSMENNRSKIDNSFTAVNLNDPDSLLPIKESLTIKQNVLYDIDTEVYFVEGITDYNYLTMFKRLLKEDNIAFLPFNGVGNNSEQTKNILSKLLKIKFHKRSLLVDADKAGKDMFNQAKESGFDTVHSMSEIKVSDTKNAMMVEDLFSKEDKEKFPAISEKNSYATAVMKDRCTLDDFSKDTVKHFSELFKLLKD